MQNNTATEQNEMRPLILESPDQLARPIIQPAALVFPPAAIVGSLGDLAHVLAHGTEVPPEFFFAASLTAMGAIVGTKLTLNLSFDVQPRLYTVLLGDSYAAKKSTAMKKAVEFFSKLEVPKPPRIVHGLGSAEGLIGVLRDDPKVPLAFDELKAFIDKTKVQSSTLLAMVTALFEQNQWENLTKSKKNSAPVKNAHLSLLGCCTTGTYANMWTPEAISIGFPNRLFVVNADRTGKVAWPRPADPTVLENLRVRIQRQIAELPKKFSIDEDAKELWEDWYKKLPSSQHTSRLDTIGFRLLLLIALITDKSSIDVQTVRTVTSILDYELAVRIFHDPIDADNTVSKLEEGIRRALSTKGSRGKRDLRRDTHADRSGLWAFEAALKNLIQAGDIKEQKGFYSLKDAVV
jgi:hypothetical protein